MTPVIMYWTRFQYKSLLLLKCLNALDSKWAWHLSDYLKRPTPGHNTDDVERLNPEAVFKDHQKNTVCGLMVSEGFFFFCGWGGQRWKIFTRLLSIKIQIWFFLDLHQDHRPFSSSGFISSKKKVTKPNLFFWSNLVDQLKPTFHK